MRKLLLLLAIIFGTAVARAEEPVPPSSKEIRQLLQQGLFEEEANRDLTKAAAAYSALVEKYDQQRAWAATALFRLAEVRAKQGDKAAAVELHQRLLAEFPNQEPLAGLSRERLATLGGTAPAAVAQPQDVTEEEARELARIREMAKNSPDLINAVDPPTRTTTPLAAAAKAGQVQVAEFLLKNGAEVNGAGKSFPPLVLAAEEGHKRMVELLLASKAEINRQEPNTGDSPLLRAAGAGRREIVRLLLERGADVKLANGLGRTALHAALTFGSSEIARLLLESGADPNATSRWPGAPLEDTPLLQAIRANSAELAELLLEKGADVNAVGADGNSALILAVGNKVLLELLLSKGARVDLQNKKGQTVLHAVVERWRAESTEADHRQLIEVLETLAAHPIPINLSDSDGRTPLHHAIAWLPRAAVLWLIEHGGDLSAKDREGTTALEYSYGSRRVFFEKRYLFPALARERALFATARFPNAVAANMERVDPVAEFEEPPTLEELLRGQLLGALHQTVMEESPTELVIYRASTAGGVEETERLPITFDPPLQAARPRVGTVLPRGQFPPPSGVAPASVLRLGKIAPEDWPTLRWGDIVVIEQELPSAPMNVVDFPVASLIPKIPRQVTLQLGDRSGKFVISGPGEERSNEEPDRVGNDVALLPSWTFSELVTSAIAAEPRADLSSVKVQRNVEGKPAEWTVDLRGENGVRELPVRISEGDTIVIPLRAPDAAALATRRGGIFHAGTGRIFGGQVFTWHGKEQGPRTIGEFLIGSYYPLRRGLPPDPDLSKITIHRLKEDGEEEHLLIDFANLMEKADGGAPEDPALQWGDVVELVPKNPSAADWKGFGSRTAEYLERTLSRHVTVVSRNEHQIFTVRPDLRQRIGNAPLFVSSILERTAVHLPEVARIRTTLGDQVREFSVEELEAIRPWVRNGERVEVELR